MFVLDVTLALILFVSMTTLLVSGGPPKRQLTKHSPNPGRPRSEEPLCRRLCADVLMYCEETCHGPRGFVVPSKYHCLSKCMNDDVAIVFKEKNCIKSPQMVHSQNKEVTSMPEEAEIDVSTLTMIDRCHMEAWVNSTVCEFNSEYPVVSKKIFDENKDKLTLCTGSPVVSGRNGFSLKKPNSQEQGQRTATLSRKERSVSDEFEGPAGWLRVNVTETQRINYTDVKNSPSSAHEFCPTLLNYESPRSAVHLATNLEVDLYFYAGYSQWFQLGMCQTKHSTTSISGNFTMSHCDVVTTAVKAWVMIDPQTFPQTEEVQNCGTVKEMPYLVCNDWVLLPTHCKLFFQE